MYSAKPIIAIDLQKIVGNYRLLASIASSSIVSAVVKADSYGLGADQISKALQKQAGCNSFFVATIDEALSLRESLGQDVDIFVLNGVFYNDLDDLNNNNLIPVLNHLGQIHIWQEYARQKGTKLPCILHIDTGLNRLGIPESEQLELLGNVDLLSGLEVKCIMSHLAFSEDSDHQYNLEQLRRFNLYVKHFPQIQKSLVSSSGIFLSKDYHFDLVRPGAALYGINPVPDKPNTLQNPVKLTAPIIQLQKLKSNTPIGYGSSFTTKRDSIIATLPIGYADGYLRSLGNNSKVYISGYSADVVGRISMDLINIDVTHIPPEYVSLGTEVEIIGENCTPDIIASNCGTLAYEILTNIGNRYSRVYLK